MVAGIRGNRVRTLLVGMGISPSTTAVSMGLHGQAHHSGENKGHQRDTRASLYSGTQGQDMESIEKPIKKMRYL